MMHFRWFPFFSNDALVRSPHVLSFRCVRFGTNNNLTTEPYLVTGKWRGGISIVIHAGAETSIEAIFHFSKQIFLHRNLTSAMFKRVHCAIVDCASWNRVFMVNRKFYAKKNVLFCEILSWRPTERRWETLALWDGKSHESLRWLRWWAMTIIQMNWNKNKRKNNRHQGRLCVNSIRWNNFMWSRSIASRTMELHRTTWWSSGDDKLWEEKLSEVESETILIH